MIKNTSYAQSESEGHRRTGAAIAEGEVWTAIEGYLGGAWARSGVARFGEAASVRSRAGQHSERQIALSVSFALERVGALSRRVGSRKHSRPDRIDNRHSGRRLLLPAKRSAPAHQRRRRRFCLLRDRR